MSHTARPSYTQRIPTHEIHRSCSVPRNLRSRSANPPKSHTLYERSRASCSAQPRPRYVLPFSIESHQKNTVVMDGPIMETRALSSTNGQKLQQKSKQLQTGKKPQVISNNNKLPQTSFRMYFDRGDLPIRCEYLCGGDKIGWTVDIEKLDYSLYLPLFFDGLAETKHPYKTYARQGVSDLLIAGGEKIPPIIPQLILPLKNALNTKNLEVMCTTLKIIQQLVRSSDLVGPALVPFYRQLLPMFNAFKVKNLNCGDKIDYSQKNNMNLGDLIDETLQVLELHGGEDAYINIKYMVPTYESCYLN